MATPKDRVFEGHLGSQIGEHACASLGGQEAQTDIYRQQGEHEKLRDLAPEIGVVALDTPSARINIRYWHLPCQFWQRGGSSLASDIDVLA